MQKPHWHGPETRLTKRKTRWIADVPAGRRAIPARAGLDRDATSMK
jgi:hypothetical protein